MIDLTAATKRKKPRAKSVSLREIVPMKSQSDDLAAIYMVIVRHWRDVAARVVAEYDPPAMTTDSQPGIESAITAGQREALILIASLTPSVNRWADILARWHTRKWAANVLSGTGVSIDTFLGNAAIADDLAAAVRWNVGLISNISDSARDRIENVVWSGWRARTPRRDMARMINEAVGIERKRALRIAVDQTTKLAGSLERDRMLEAGLDTWIWRHSEKRYPRVEHVARNGKIPRQIYRGSFLFVGVRLRRIST